MDQLTLLFKEITDEIEKGAEYWRSAQVFHKLTKNAYEEEQAKTWADAIEHSDEGLRLKERIAYWESLEQTVYVKGRLRIAINMLGNHNKW